MPLTMVVLPTPGPPVMTRTLDCRANRMAAIWLSASDRPVLRSIQGSAFSGSMWGQGSGPLVRRRNSLGDDLFSLVQAAEENAGRSIGRVRDHRSVCELDIQSRQGQFRRDLQQL